MKLLAVIAMYVVFANVKRAPVGNARKELEEKSGRKVVSSSNFLSPTIEEK